MSGMSEDCPQCGQLTRVIVEGVCGDCWDDNQASLDAHNAAYDRWQSMNDKQRGDEIKRAAGI